MSEEHDEPVDELLREVCDLVDADVARVSKEAIQAKLDRILSKIEQEGSECD